MSGKHCSLGIIDPLLMLQSFFPLFLYGDPEPLKEGCDILIPFRPQLSTVFYSLHVDYFNVSMLIAIYCREKSFLYEN